MSDAPGVPETQWAGQSCCGFVSVCLSGAGFFIWMEDSKGRLFGGGWLGAKEMWLGGW